MFFFFLSSCSIPLSSNQAGHCPLSFLIYIRRTNNHTMPWPVSVWFLKWDLHISSTSSAMPEPATSLHWGWPRARMPSFRASLLKSLGLTMVQFESKRSPLPSWRMISSVLILPLYRGCAQKNDPQHRVICRAGLCVILFRCGDITCWVSPFTQVVLSASVKARRHAHPRLSEDTDRCMRISVMV